MSTDNDNTKVVKNQPPKWVQAIEYSQDAVTQAATSAIGWLAMLPSGIVVSLSLYPSFREMFGNPYLAALFVSLVGFILEVIGLITATEAEARRESEARGTTYSDSWYSHPESLSWAVFSLVLVIIGATDLIPAMVATWQGNGAVKSLGTHFALFVLPIFARIGTITLSNRKRRLLADNPEIQKDQIVEKAIIEAFKTEAASQASKTAKAEMKTRNSLGKRGESVETSGDKNQEKRDPATEIQTSKVDARQLILNVIMEFGPLSAKTIAGHLEDRMSPSTCYRQLGNLVEEKKLSLVDGVYSLPTIIQPIPSPSSEVHTNGVNSH